MSDKVAKWVDEKVGTARHIISFGSINPVDAEEIEIDACKYRDALIEAVEVMQRANAAYFDEPDRAIAAIKMYDELSSFILEGLDEQGT